MEKSEMSALDAYLNRVYRNILLFTPTCAIIAAVTVTVLYVIDWYPYVNTRALTVFDFSTLMYLGISIYLIRTGFGENGIVLPNKLYDAKVSLGVIIVAQWNAISYIWPFTEFWAYAMFFIILEAFFFDVKMTAWTSIGIALSIIISWIFGSDLLLPVRDEYFLANMAFRIIGLTLMLISINVMTYFGGKYLVAELEKYFNYDTLTHLLNRRSMDNYLQAAYLQAKTGKTTFCLMLMDIDNFKSVNDTYGHDCGDEVLKAVAGIVSANVRKSDHVFRWGGEEILVLINADEEKAVALAESIRADVEKNIINYRDKLEVKVTVTIGVSPYENGKSIQQMMDDSDSKLYYGKRHGKNQVVNVLPDDTDKI